MLNQGRPMISAPRVRSRMQFSPGHYTRVAAPPETLRIQCTDREDPVNQRLFWCAVAIAAASVAQHQHEGAARERIAQLLPGLGNLHHPIATSNAEAQRFFDQGLTLVYAFNHEEAILSFRRAAELDPDALMPLWGIALALGPNINMDVDAAAEKAAWQAEQTALAHSARAPEKERAYVQALARRYSGKPDADLRKLAAAYRDAMREVSATYPDDLDAATLYAESIMDVHPWQLWRANGSPEEGTPELLSVLEGVLRRDPNHIGANHYYIHSMEASPNPERALPSAKRLETLAPGAGHLVHMPGHIYIRLGYYEEAARANERAIEADEAYVKLTGARTMYSSMYYHHNIHFLTVARAEQGRVDETKAAAAKLDAGIRRILPEMPMAEGFVTVPMTELLRVHSWDDALALAEPGNNLPTATAFWHFSRAMALAATNRRDGALEERDAFRTAVQRVPADAMFGTLNMAHPVLDIASEVLAARLASVADSIPHWKKAVGLQDSLGYDEPADWYYPVRESLGAALLLNGDAAASETTFRECLVKTPLNGRALFGLMESLKAQQKTADLESLQREFDGAWRGATMKLRIEEL